MKTDVVVQTTALTNGSVNHSLREGSSVLVRILKNNGNNSYRAAFAGRQFNITSALNLKEGTALMARIKLEDGKILLQKVEQAAVQSEGLEKISLQTGSDGKITNPALVTYFKKLGLIPDSLTCSMFQQMKQLGLTFNSEKFNLIRKLSERFIGKEKEAAQIAMILEQKNLEADFDSVWAILDDETDSNIFFPEQEKLESESNQFKKFFEDIFSGIPVNEKSRPGVLTLFNHLGLKYGKPESNGSWIKIPFEFSYKKDGKIRNGHGSFNSFFEKSVINQNKCCINFNFSVSKYLFVLYFKCKKCNKITVAFPETYSEAEKNRFLEKMKEVFPDIVLEGMVLDEANEFFAENSEILSYRGMA